MSEQEKNPPAFPLQYDPYIDHPSRGRIHRAEIGEEAQTQPGMTLRDYFAAKAMQALIDRKHLHNSPQNELNDIPDTAYQIADAMLKYRQ